jgi:hypothetical protein
VTGWSEDVELLELTAPGHYKTIDTVNGVEVAPATTSRLTIGRRCGRDLVGRCSALTVLR